MSNKNSNNKIQRKTFIEGLVILTTYYYYIEDSIINIYKSTIEYLKGDKESDVKCFSQEFGDFDIIKREDYITENENSFWLGSSIILKSLKESIYKPRIEYTPELLADFGYKPLSGNEGFKKQPCNCFIYADKSKYEMLNEIINIWNLKKINIHIISGPYQHEEYNLFSHFNSSFTSSIDVTFHNTHLHKFDKESVIEFINKNPKEFKFWKYKTDTAHLVVLNEPDFEIDAEVYATIANDNQRLIIFEKDLEKCNKFVEYVSIPSIFINKYNEIFKQNYPTINSDDIYVIYVQKEYESMLTDMSYLRL
jgi:hypothetical protein